MCLGNNSRDTDDKTTELSQQGNSVNHGLIDRCDFIPNDFGYYHTSLTDLSLGDILQLADRFDKIILLDQPSSEWSHTKLLLSTYKLMKELERLGHDTEYKDNNNIKKYDLFNNILKENKSFCIYPWINLIEEHGYTTVCARSQAKVTTIKEIGDWKTNPDYQAIRQSMLKGEMMPDRCSTCYYYESHDIESYRIHETLDWVSKLDINSLEDLDKITRPYYHEIRLSNKCNLMCRSCKPEHAHLIDQEYKKFNIIYPGPQSFKYSSTAHIDIETLDPKTRVYLTGGDPTVITEVYDFMERCIERGRTDFDFTLGINGAKLSPRFLELTDHFTNLNFSISLDGYGRINDYWRWGSDWDTIIKNMHLLGSRGHTLSINCVPGIYNVTNLHLLFEFLDREFPTTTIYTQINNLSFQSVFIHPNAKLVVESMERCKQTKVYDADGKSTKTAIDSLYSYYINNPTCDLNLLKEFFEYNDKLDQSRNVKLADYIPELEECRKYIK